MKPGFVITCAHGTTCFVISYLIITSGKAYSDTEELKIENRSALHLGLHPFKRCFVSIEILWKVGESRWLLSTSDQNFPARTDALIWLCKKVLLKLIVFAGLWFQSLWETQAIFCFLKGTLYSCLSEFWYNLHFICQCMQKYLPGLFSWVCSLWAYLGETSFQLIKLCFQTLDVLPLWKACVNCLVSVITWAQF